MKIFQKVILSALALTLVVAPLASVKAQEVKPAAVFSIASVDEQFADAEYLLTAAGFPEFVGFLAFGKAAVEGVDTTKPIGGYVTVVGMQPQFVAFVGTKDLDALLAKHADKIGEAEDAGNGVKKITGPGGNSVYLKADDNGWAFASNEAMNLASLPADPVKMLGGLEKNYNIAMQFNMQNVPKELKAMAVAKMKEGFDESLKNQLDQDEATRQLTEKLGGNFLNSMVELVEQSDQITVGWSVDSMAKSTHIDMSLSAVQGTKLAQRMAMLENSKSGFAGFLLPDSAVNLNFVSKMTKEDIEVTLAMIKVMGQQALKELDNDGDLSDVERAAAKDVLGSLFGIINKTIESGKLDGGATVLLAPDAITVAAGGYVADGDGLEALLKKVATLAKDEPDFPGIKFNADTHGNVRFHTMKIPVPGNEAEARKLLGEELDVAIGIGGKSFYLAFGKNAVPTLKGIIDKSTADAEKVVPPSQVTVALTPIVKFAASVSDDENIGKVVAALDQVMGKDKIVISSRSIERGGLTRFELQEGVLKSIGVGVKAAQQAFFGGGGGF